VIISLIAAMDEKGGIGKNNRLPWHLPSDLKRFKKLTMGHNLVMGRKTYETIGKSLPGRVMIVVTHQLDYFPKDCKIVSSLDAAIKMAQDNHESEVFVIGGGEIFHQAFGLADRIYLTTVHTDVDAEVLFPKIDLNQWEIYESDPLSKYEEDDYASDFKILSRKH
jgi:dihydrofolate reductase